eukprot:TRINITY_DN30196_c0_g1_i1.p1 TRINITY_DN30196_c0_g1~~TRINITY_DN30196_c0_g1_i1.p1  ORF type:complete len:525 (-),score=71.06 TRINITY_DN30196_c0_g1_i1:85-1491(-)
MVALCLVFAFLAAGLTMGLISLEPEKIRNLLNTDEVYAHTEDEKEQLREQKMHGRRVLPLIENHHRLLVTLLLTNSVANEALPIFLTRLVPAWAAVLVSVTLVLVFGEIIPSAVFTGPSQLSISARFSPVVVAFQVSLCFIVRPMASFLDYALGCDHRGAYQQGELVAMLASDQLEGAVEDDTKKMLLGALDTERKHVGDEDILTPMGSVFMLPISGQLDCETMADIIHHGHSRVPIYEGHKHNVRGFLIVKRLLLHDPKKPRALKTMFLKLPEVFHINTTLRDALNVFQQGTSHIALVVSNKEAVHNAWKRGLPIPADVHMAGIVTLEKILEIILREHIEDEDDRRRAQLMGASRRSMRPKGSTCDLSDTITEEQLISVCFWRWKTEWRICRQAPRRPLYVRAVTYPSLSSLADANEPEISVSIKQPLLSANSRPSLAFGGLRLAISQGRRHRGAGVSPTAEGGLLV